MSDWMSRAKANAIAQDNALRLAKYGLSPGRTKAVSIQTNKSTPAKSAGGGNKPVEIRTVEFKHPVVQIAERSNGYRPTTSTQKSMQEWMEKAIRREAIKADDSRKRAHRQELENKKMAESYQRSRDDAGIRNSFANRDHEAIKKQAEENSERVRLEANNMAQANAQKELDYITSREYAHKRDRQLADLNSNTRTNVSPSVFSTISPTLKSNMDDFVRSASIGFVDNPRYGEMAVKNARANGLTDFADALEDQFGEMYLPEENLRQRQAESQTELDDLMQQRDLYIGMMAGGGQLTEEQQTELLRIEKEIETAWNNVDAYAIQADKRVVFDWEDRNKKEIQQAEQVAWNPKDREKKLEDILSNPLTEEETYNQTTVATRNKEIEDLQTDLLGMLRKTACNCKEHKRKQV